MSLHNLSLCSNLDLSCSSEPSLFFNILCFTSHHVYPVNTFQTCLLDNSINPIQSKILSHHDSSCKSLNGHQAFIMINSKCPLFQTRGLSVGMVHQACMFQILINSTPWSRSTEVLTGPHCMFLGDLANLISSSWNALTYSSFPWINPIYLQTSSPLGNLPKSIKWVWILMLVSSCILLHHVQSITS